MPNLYIFEKYCPYWAKSKTLILTTLGISNKKIAWVIKACEPYANAWVQGS
jgi:hypothetical protein